MAELKLCVNELSAFLSYNKDAGKLLVPKESRRGPVSLSEPYAGDY